MIPTAAVRRPARRSSKTRRGCDWGVSARVRKRADCSKIPVFTALITPDKIITNRISAYKTPARPLQAGSGLLARRRASDSPVIAGAHLCAPRAGRQAGILKNHMKLLLLPYDSLMPAALWLLLFVFQSLGGTHHQSADTTRLPGLYSAGNRNGTVKRRGLGT